VSSSAIVAAARGRLRLAAPGQSWPARPGRGGRGLCGIVRKGPKHHRG